MCVPHRWLIWHSSCCSLTQCWWRCSQNPSCKSGLSSFTSSPMPSRRSERWVRLLCLLHTHGRGVLGPGDENGLLSSVWWWERVYWIQFSYKKVAQGKVYGFIPLSLPNTFCWTLKTAILKLNLIVLVAHGAIGSILYFLLSSPTACFPWCSFLCDMDF